MLGLRFCARAFSSCGEWGPLFIAVRGPVTIAASLVAEQRLQTRRLSSCGSRAQSLRGMWDLPRPGLEPVSPALAGRLSTAAPPGKPQNPPLMAHLPCHTWRKNLIWCPPKHKSGCTVTILGKIVLSQVKSFSQNHSVYQSAFSILYWGNKHPPMSQCLGTSLSFSIILHS